MLEVHTEHLENHTARLTVKVDPERINQAMRQTARRLSKKARIPGFRSGKAPFNIIVSTFGYDQVLNEALNNIGADLYRDALETTEIEPYGVATLEDIQDGGQTLIFVQPKQPVVDLGDYRELRVDYEEPEVADEMVSYEVELLRQNQAIVEKVDRPAQWGDQVILDHVTVTLVSTEDEVASAESSVDEPSNDVVVRQDAVDAEDVEDAEDNVLLDEHDYDYVLFEEDDALYPGFAAEIIEKNAGDNLEFYLDIPEDSLTGEVEGKRVLCQTAIAQVNARHVPEWTDDLAQRVSNKTCSTLLDLRVMVREELQAHALQLSDQSARDKGLEQLIANATLHYSEEFAQSFVDIFVEGLKSTLKQQKLKLDDWLRITQQTEAEVREQYREGAVAQAESALVLGEFVQQEQLTVSEDRIEAEIDKLCQSLNNEQQAEKFRQQLNTEQSRQAFENELLTNLAVKRLLAIVKGENPSIELSEKPVEEETEIEVETSVAIIEGENDIANDSDSTSEAELTAEEAGEAGESE